MRHRVRFLVVGLSAAALQGAPVVTEDVDLWFENLSDPRLSKALTQVGAGYVPPFELNPPMLAGPGSAPFDVVVRMDGLEPFGIEWIRALEIRVGKLRLKVLPLERILARKTAANRPKDQRVLAVLENALLTLRSLRSTKSARRRKATSRGKN